MRLTARHLLLLACFFLSGLAALVYQTAWTREFAFVFGTSELAVATVLAAYMGGLAAGAALAGRFVARVRRPLLGYGLLELGIALAALAVPLAIQASRRLYVAFFAVHGSPPSEGGLPSALFFLAASFAILLVPTALMGATLPLLARHAVREESEIGTRIGALYATNTLGAVFGTVLGAFFLLPALGLRRTVLVAVALNGLVFAAAALLARVSPFPAPAAAPVAGAPPVRGDRRVLPLIALSGVASFGYEVLWTRLLTHVLGGSVYAFGTMLASFLVGIALGSAVSMRWTRTREAAARAFAAAQLGTAALSMLAYTLVDRLPNLASQLDASGGERLFVDAGLAIAILLPAALCIGATFPLAVRLAAAGAEDAGPASARVYAWNTVGAIVGAVGTGFFVLPALGFEGTLGVALAINLALALAGATLAPPHGRRLAVAAALGLIALALARPAPPWSLLRTDPWTRSPAPEPIAFYRVGRSATVLLLEQPFGGWSLRTNGLQDAQIPAPGARLADYAVGYWLSLLPVLARPDLESMLVVGLGGGVVVEAVPPSVRSVDVIELEPEVVAANRSIAKRRARDPLADPRLRLHVNDARGALVLMEGGLDAIVSQPSHPWTAGASHLYSREFFELVRDRLAPDGVFVQWMGLSFVDEPLLRSLVATLVDVFPHVQLFQPGNRPAVMFVASREPLDVERDSLRALGAAPDFFATFGLSTREDVAAALVLDDAGARSLAAGAPLVRDDWNLLQMRSPGEPRRAITERVDGVARIRGRGLSSAESRRLFEAHDRRTGLAPDVEPIRLVRALIDFGDDERASRVADALADPAARHAARGWVAASRGDVAAAKREMKAALRIDAADHEARAGLLVLEKRKLGDGVEPGRLGLSALSRSEAALVEGWRQERRRDFEGARGLEAELATIRPGDALFREATRLRASWRVASADPEHAREARQLLDLSLARSIDAGDLLLRARAALLAGETDPALATLSELRDRLGAVRGESPEWVAQRAQIARDALRVLEDLPRDDARPGLGSVLREHFQRLASTGRLG